jgi:hypothetical protein
MSGYNAGSSINTSIGSLSIACADNDPAQFRYRVIATTGDFGYFNMSLTASGDVTLNVSEQSETPIEFPFDSGWQIVSGTISGTGTITGLTLTAGAQSDGVQATIYFDSVYVAESPGGVVYTYRHSATGLPGTVAI